MSLQAQLDHFEDLTDDDIETICQTLKLLHKQKSGSTTSEAACIDHLLVHGTETDLNFNIFLQPTDEIKNQTPADRVLAYKELIHK